jgi:hypothetical protein
LRVTPVKNQLNAQPFTNSQAVYCLNSLSTCQLSSLR